MRFLPHSPVPCYHQSMSTIVGQAVAALQTLPADRRDVLANVIVEEAGAPTVPYSPELAEAVEEGLADAAAGRFTSDEAVASVYAHYR